MPKKGYQPTEEHRMNLSKSLKGKQKSEEHRKNLSIAHTGKPSPNKGKHSLKKGKTYEEFFGEKAQEIKKKQRIAAIKRREKNNGQYWPNYNKQACEVFKSFDEQHNTKGIYAMYGGGEYHIKELGYFLDYFNSDKKLIMEFDEFHHFDENGNLKEYDVTRQQEIQELYPDFKFIRIKEKSLNTKTKSILMEEAQWQQHKYRKQYLLEY